MALNAGIVGLNIVEARGIDNIATRGVRVVFAAWAVTLFAANVPLDNFLGVNVVTNGMAAIAGWACGPLHVVRRIKGLPPVSSLCNEIEAPLVYRDIPLSGLWVVVVANLREVALLPQGTVNQRDLIFGEFRDCVGGQIGNDSVWEFVGVANDIGHGRFLPVLICLRVALLAGLRSGILGRSYGGSLLKALFAGGLAETANEENQFPAIVGVFLVRFGPPWHTREADAVADDVADLAVRQILRLRDAQVGSLRIEVAANGCLPGAVRAVADGAAVKISFARFFQNIGRGLPRICFEASLVRNGKIAGSASNGFFRQGRLLSSAEPAPDEMRCVQTNGEEGCRDKKE